MRKNVSWLFTSFIFLWFISCRKEHLLTNGLPPATQTGANTFGFLLNGKPWIPSGYDSYMNNLSLYLDPGYRNGVFEISAYQFFNGGTTLLNTQVGIFDSLNFMKAPVTLNMGVESLYGISYQ